MRLAEIRHILSSEVDYLTAEADSILNSPNVTVVHHREAVHAVKMIQTTGVLVLDTGSVLAHHELAHSASEKIVVHIDTYRSFKSSLDSLSLKAKIIINFIDEFIGDELPDTVSIKLPSYKDMDKVAKNMTTLKLALDQALLHEPMNGSVELVSFERGSNWIEVSIGGALAYGFIGGMLRLIYASREKEIELDAKRELVKSIKVQNEAKEMFLSAIDKELEEYYTNSVGVLLAEHNVSDDDKEYPARLGHSLRLLSELISEGVEVHPTLIASETASAFPDPQKLVHTLGSLPDKLIDLMANGSKEGAEGRAPQS